MTFLSHGGSLKGLYLRNIDRRWTKTEYTLIFNRFYDSALVFKYIVGDVLSMIIRLNLL